MHDGGTMVRRVGVSVALAVALIGSLPRAANADAIRLSIDAPSFLIPLDGKSGVLDVYADGTATPSGGFNALGTQSFDLSGNGGTSSGSLQLNLHFSGFPFGDPSQEITDATLHLWVYDLDLNTDQVTSRITLLETAIISSVTGESFSIDLYDYLPTPTTPTDDRTIRLNPIPLFPPLTPGFYDNPFIISIGMTATATNTGSQTVRLTNTPEQIVPKLELDVTSHRVPEPGSMLLLGIGLATVASGRAFRRRERSTTKRQ
jgi:hypothetical protein